MSRREVFNLPLPSTIKSALLKAGYETVDDLHATTGEALAKDLNIPVASTQIILSASQSQRAAPLTQSAATMVGGAIIKYSTLCKPVDVLLEGGLKRGFVLEISGPPGTVKESLAINLTHSLVQANEEVLFADMQNMTSPETIMASLGKFSTPPNHFKQMIKHLDVHTLPDLIIFFNQLSAYLQANPKIGLLVLNSFWFPFQSQPGLSPSARNALLTKIKDILTKACATTHLTVVITTQLATKLVNADGSPANFDTGSRAIMVPQPGNQYLPNGRTYRIILVPQSRTSGVVRLLSSPAHVQQHDHQPQAEEPYELIAGVMN